MLGNKEEEEEEKRKLNTELSTNKNLEKERKNTEKIVFQDV